MNQTESVTLRNSPDLEESPNPSKNQKRPAAMENSEEGQKRCNRCHQSKPANEVGPKNGQCAECRKELQWLYRRTPQSLELRRASDRARREKNREKFRTKWNNSYREKKKSRTDEDFLKLRARSKVRDAVRFGKINKPDRCQTCGGMGIISGHHKDYSKPLEVDWLCPLCHSQEHMKHK